MTNWMSKYLLETMTHQNDLEQVLERLDEILKWKKKSDAFIKDYQREMDDIDEAVKNLQEDVKRRIERVRKARKKP